MGSTYRYHTVTGPSRGKARAFAVSGTQADFDLSDATILSDLHRDGEYITVSCNQVFYCQFSDAEGDTINITQSIADDSDVGEDHDEHPGGPFAANTPYRMLVPKNDSGVLETWLHVIAAGAGILRLWKSSSNKV